MVEELNSKGFTNIKLKRNNKLLLGILGKEGEVEKISIGGSEKFTETDVFKFDEPIIIIVNTFKEKGCEDITDIA